MNYSQVFMRVASIVLTFTMCAQSYVTTPAAVRRGKDPAQAAWLAPVATKSAATVEGRLAPVFGQLPLMFEANKGQVASERVRFISRNKGYTLFLTPEGATLSLSSQMPQADSRTRGGAAGASSVVEMRMDGASSSPVITGEDELGGKVNYIRGRDRRSWQTNVATYGRVRYREIYKGIDLVYYGNQGNIEYDFIVQPWADPNLIRFRFDGARAVLNDAGDLVLRVGYGALTMRRPHLYQYDGGARKEVQGEYRLDENGVVRFSVGRYDCSQPLVIDPVLTYASFFGSEFDNTYETDITVDAQGNAYVVGYTNSPEFLPTTQGSFRRTDTEQDGETFVAKLAPDGSSFIYSTFIGGAVGRSIAVDAAGNAYLTGIADSAFPIRNGFQPQLAETANGGARVDAFIAKLNADGSDLLYSSFIGGNDADLAFSVTVDASGNAYVSGETSSTNFPITQGAARTTRNDNNDAFITRVNTNATGAASLSYSTYTDVGRAVAIDSQGNAYVAGNDVFFKKQSVVKLNPSGTAFVYNYNVNGDELNNSTRALWYVKDIAVDSEGNAYVTGSTVNAANSSFMQGGFQTTFGGGRDAFLAKLNASGTNIIYSTYIGGSGNEVGRGISVDASGNAYVTGSTTSRDFPLRDALQPRHNGGFPDTQDIITFETSGPTDAFVTKISTNASGQSSLVYSTYYGFDRNETGNSIAVDSQGNAYVLCGLAPFGTPGIIHTPRTPVPASALVNAGLNKSGEGGNFVIKIANEAANAIEFAAATFTVDEAGRNARITVTRRGDTSGAASVEYMTLSDSASERSDYTTTTGTLRFKAGETTKTFDVLITDDTIQEGSEAFGVALLNPSSGYALGTPLSATVAIQDNDATTAASNPIDDSQFFVRQHYLDFLGREPDASGFAFWTNQIEECGSDQQCRAIRRINISAAFFLSIEFQETGLYAIRVQRVAFGRKSADVLGRFTYREMTRAARRVGEGVVVGEPGAAAQLEANKQAYAESIVNSPAFVEKYPTSLEAAAYVSALYVSAGVQPTAAEREAAIQAYGSGGFAGRVAALRSAADSTSVRASERNTAFVLLQYLGYLRRDPDQNGYNFWLTKLLQHGGNFVNAEMVKSFITSDEYRARFGR